VKSDAKFVELCRNLLSHQPEERMTASDIIQHPSLREAKIVIESQLKKNAPNAALKLKEDLCSDDKLEVKRIFKQDLFYFELAKDYEFRVKYQRAIQDVKE